MFPTRYSVPLTGLDFLQWYGSHQVYHPGVDFNYGSGWDDFGQEVFAAKDGVVVYIHDNVSTSSGFGKFVIIRHSGSIYTRSSHLREITVKNVGTRVQEGDIIGYLGNTGTSSPHLHFEVFNEKMADKQRAHWREWRFYPSKKTKQYILEHYLNPWEWLRSEEEINVFAEAQEWVVKNNISNGERAKDPVTREELWQMLRNYHEQFGDPERIMRFKEEN